MRITKGQIAYLGNTLHELLHSFNVEDFYFAVGSSREAVEGLADLLEDHYIACRNDELCDLRFSSTEALILRNASLLCAENLSREQFQSRLGESPESARRFIRQIEPAEATPVLQI